MSSYYVSIQRLDTEQRVFVGLVKGPLTPFVEGAILENARQIDAGKRLTRRQLKRAYHDVR